MSHPDLDLDVAQALFAVRMLEAAVHHPGPWTFKWGEVEVPAEKTISADGVTFVGEFPEVCYLSRPQGGLEIRCEGVVMGIRPADQQPHPGDTGFEVTWSVRTHRVLVEQ